MWGAITKIFTKNNNNSFVQSGAGETAAEMDRGDIRRADMNSEDSRQAKQRASVKWLLSKAFNNKVPENLKEPFYRDHENQEHLKPQIVGALANAEMYCLALGNIYTDPNYHNLNHWSILQTLTRKGAFVTEPSDSQLTETTLIQTNPLRMSAHMAVVESIMTLYAKEVVTADRVMGAVQRFSHGHRVSPPAPVSYEEGLLLWVNHANEALMKRIQQDMESGLVTNGDGGKPKLVEIPAVKELKELCDGVALAGLISYYCADELPWTDMKVSYLPSVSESLHNLNLVQDFCMRCLPASVFHMLPEDVTYMRGTMKQNLIVFLADLFNLLEIHPLKCVRYSGMDKSPSEGFPARNAHGVVHKRNLPPSVMTPIPDLRSGLDNPITSQAFQVIRTPSHQALRKTNSLQQSMSEMSEDSLRRGSDDSFVVHRGKNIPTLSSIVYDEPMAPARGMRATANGNKQQQAAAEAAAARAEELKVAGRPSHYNDNKRTFAGRRSRRNSTSDDSQLTIENFGGSQDNINFIGRNTDKEVGAHTGRKLSSAPMVVIVPIDNPAVRTSLQDARGSIQIGYDNGFEKHETEKQENHKLKRQISSDEIILRNMHERNKENIMQDIVDGEVNNRMSFADLSKKQIIGDQKGIQLVYMQQQHEKEELPSKSSFLNKSNNTTNGNNEKKTTSFATLPNTTTWQQQQSSSSSINNQPENSGDDRGDGVMASQLSDIRMKLEEKRRHIENEKRRMEMAMNKQKQKVGKAAFLQAVVKGKGGLVKSSSDVMVDSLMSSSQPPTSSSSSDVVGNVASAIVKPARPLTLQEISDDVSSVERKWMDQDGQPFVETRRTPDMENMDLETYQQSISHMNSSLHDIQADMQRLANQQNQMHFAQQQQQLLAQQQKQIIIQQQQQQLQQQQHIQQQNPQHLQQQQQQGFQHQHTPYNSQQSYNQQYSQGPIYNPLQSSASAPHIPQSLYQQSRIHSEPQFFLHGGQQQTPSPPPPVAPQRRTWAQQATTSPMGDNYHQQQQQQQQQQPEMRTWGKPQNPAGFLLHDSTPERYERYQDINRYQNGSGDQSINHSTASTGSGFTLSQQHQMYGGGAGGGSIHSTPSTSPQHRQHRQISQLLDGKRASPVSLQNMMEPIRPERRTNVMHAPIPAPSMDDMEPQSISFIGTPDEHISESKPRISRLNITSGSRTYRIPSPTRPVITRNSFQPSPPPPLLDRESPIISDESAADPANKKGFYISFDNEQPKRPKPPLRTKKGSPKKERSFINDDDTTPDRIERDVIQSKLERRKQLERELDEDRLRKEIDEKRKREQLNRQKREATSQEQEKVNAASAIIIGSDLSNPDPDSVDEREKKKERILMLSMQRRQQQEELKSSKEMEAHARREREKAKDDEKLRKKEDQIARREAILQQYKLKKAIEEAEREGKDIDKGLLNSLKPQAKMRAKGSTSRPRPKTIHIDSGSVEMAEGLLKPSRGAHRGSNSNLTANSYTPSTMKRDYYRGSQDSLASTGLLYKDSPDDSRGGLSPSHSANQTLGRRSSYKTSRDPSPAQTRGRPKYSTYNQNLKGRKSNSMMNLHGSSTDQDSLVYRYGDTDSGLGRATPPRRAPSPGMGPARHLPSPSGPGSLPGLMSKQRRVFDDGSSDISSTPSSMMDYTGPRLYKQPATKSNRGIMFNAVEYCVFPGAVNREAKSRVLEEIARSDSKHFLILFRDAGCQFRALYSFIPEDEHEEVIKLYGTGPKQVNDRMFDRFFKYNSGGKCFAQVHTKHLTVTIDAFTIHNSLWQGKKVNLPSKKDMVLVI